MSEGYRYRNLGDGLVDGSAKQDFVIVTLSGGGMRAAALAYGVLAHLNDARIDRDQTLLDKVDVISSVSAGSFAAAYYGLFGRDRFLRQFKTDVLYRQIDEDLTLRLLNPWNWFRLLSPDFGRSDLADEYYDRNIFEGRTFAAKPMRRPFIIIKATDLSLGADFSFIQEDFDRLCSDLSAVHVSRAVAASAAFPQVFSPLTFRNYPKSECGYTRPDWVTRGLQDFHTSPSRYARASDWKSYEDASRRPFIHLSDGGIADNIGLRGPEVAITTNESSWSIKGMIDRGLIKRLVVIIVDSRPTKPPLMDRSASPPGFKAQLSASETNPMENYSADTVELLRQRFDEWNRAAASFDLRRHECDDFVAHSLVKPHAAPGIEKRFDEDCYKQFGVLDTERPPYPALYEVHVRLQAIQDETMRERLTTQPTALQLPKQDVDLLVKTAATLLDQSAEYQKLLTDLRKEAGSH